MGDNRFVNLRTPMVPYRGLVFLVEKTISMSDWALNAILCLKERQIDKLVIPLKLGEKNVTVLGSFRLTCP